MCAVLLPPGDNPITVNKYINIIVNVRKSSCKVHVILVRFQSNSNFVDRFSKKNHT